MSLFDRFKDNKLKSTVDTIVKQVKHLDNPSYLFTSKELDWNIIEVSEDDENLIWHNNGKCKEFTYIMEDYSYGAYKIGKTSKSPELRLRDFQTGNPSIKLLFAFPSLLYSESDLHKRFSDYRKDDEGDSGKEWFFKTNELKLFVNTHLESINLFTQLYIDYKKNLDKAISQLNQLKSL